jgi:hypothetical protein
MRHATPFRLLLVPAALLAAACADRPDLTGPQEAPAVEDGLAAADEVPARGDLASLLGDRAHWADGYLSALYPTAPSYSPGAGTSFNRSGGPMLITKPASTTGRYIVTFSGLSTHLGGKSTVHVTGLAFDDTYCKPAGAFLVSDKVEVRCFKASTGAPANTPFTVLVTRNYSDLAFAYAHQPTGTNYSPNAAGSWNPVGTTKVVRTGVGRYDVVFNTLGSELPPNVYGHVQVNGVGTNKAHCKVHTWGGSPNLTVSVGCYTTPTGAAVDSKFTVLFLVPTEHLAYAWADSPVIASYAPSPAYSTNPAGGTIQILRQGVGSYRVSWSGASSKIFGYGTMHVTAWGEEGAICQVEQTFTSGIVEVRCFAANGVAMDSRFDVLIGS